MLNIMITFKFFNLRQYGRVLREAKQTEDSVFVMVVKRRPYLVFVHDLEDLLSIPDVERKKLVFVLGCQTPVFTMYNMRMITTRTFFEILSEIT